jgi:MFS family permease
MTAIVETNRPRAVAIGAGVVPLLALAVFINYVDRGNLATAAPLIKDELRLSNTQIGVLLSAFFWTYTPSQLLAGWLAERINAYRTLAIGLALWAVATAATSLASGFIVLLGLRLLLGLGESAAFPCSSKLLAHHLPSEKLGAANGLIGVGLALGPAVGTFVGGLIMAAAGWRPAFLVFGLASALWLWPWLATTRSASAHADRPTHDRAPSFLEILRHREAWGACLGHFASNYSFYFVVTWLPLYLVKARGLTMSEMAQVGGFIYLVYAASSMVTGVLTDRWIRAGASPNLVRKATIITSHLVVGASMLGCAVGDASVSLASLLFAGVAYGINTPMIFAIGQTLAGSRAAGKWMGLQNCVGNCAGIVVPIVTGVVVDKTGSFFWAFIITAAVGLTGVVGWGLVIRKVAPVQWRAGTC